MREIMGSDLMGLVYERQTCWERRKMAAGLMGLMCLKTEGAVGTLVPS